MRAVPLIGEWIYAAVGFGAVMLIALTVATILGLIVVRNAERRRTGDGRRPRVE